MLSEITQSQTSREALLGWRCAKPHSRIQVLAIYLHNEGEIITGDMLMTPAQYVQCHPGLLTYIC